MPAPTNDKAAATLAEVLRIFESGEFPAAVERTVIHRLSTDPEQPSSKWSLGNQIIMLLIGGTTDARGFKQWQEVGRRVKKGAKAFSILGPITRRIDADDADAQADDADRTARVIVTGFHTIPVFRLEDTEGDAIARADYTPAALPPLREVADALGLSVSYSPFIADAYGVYIPDRKQIRLMTHDVKTWFHELSHAADHSVHPDELKPGQDPKTEIVAEVAAVTLARLYGFEGWEWHGARYVAQYAKTDPARAAMQLISRIQRILDRILSLAGTPATEVAA